MSKYNLYWWGAVDHPENVGPRLNFGDILSPLFFNYFNIDYRPADTFQESNIISIGSVARLAKDGDVVIGSGIIRSKELLNPNAIWKSVRGPLTRNAVLYNGGQCPDIYGDPALLLPLICDESNKEYDVGLIPHYTHYNALRVINKAKKHNYHIIDVRNSDPLEVVKEITKCRKIVSSSLHGIICAHAYGIPAAWINIPLHGDQSKFHDHYQSVGLQAEPSRLKTPKYTTPQKINTALLVEAFESLAN